MSELICTIFNVEHGFCAFIRSPNLYSLLIDCGSRPRFSPIKWIRRNYNLREGNIKYFKGRRHAKCIITHLHADHFDDVGSFDRKNERPRILLRDKKTLKFIDDKIKQGGKTREQRRRVKVLKAFKKFSEQYTEDADDVAWGFDSFKTRQIAYSDAESITEDREKIINNRSFLTSVTFADRKILIPGDILVKGWEKALEKSAIQNLVANTNFFVTSHHGHKTGFTTEILDYSGIPDIYILSARRGDEEIDTAYNDPKNSHGYRITGDKGKSRVVSTRKRGQSIQIVIREDGTDEITVIEAKDNLSASQASLRDKHTERKLKRWGIR